MRWSNLPQSPNVVILNILMCIFLRLILLLELAIISCGGVTEGVLD
jgi:hypothetical protein